LQDLLKDNTLRERTNCTDKDFTALCADAIPRNDYNRLIEEDRDGCDSPNFIVMQSIQQKYFSNDFLGYLKGKPIDIKKLKVLEIFRYLHRISMEKVKKFSDNNIFMLLLLYYVKKSELKRIHQSVTMRKNISVYYRAIENLINNSRYNHQLLAQEGQMGCIIDNILPKEWYTITKGGKNERYIISLEKVHEANKALNLQ